MSSKPTKSNNDTKDVKGSTKEYNIQVTNEARLYKHNYKLNEEDQKDICLNYLFNKGNIHTILDKYHISEQTYYNVINKHKKNDFKILDEEIAELRRNFSKKTSIIIGKVLDKIEDQLDNGEIDINKLSTTLGILYDKESLELGKATSNSAFNINIKIDK